MTKERKPWLRIREKIIISIFNNVIYRLENYEPDPLATKGLGSRMCVAQARSQLIDNNTNNHI